MSKGIIEEVREIGKTPLSKIDVAKVNTWMQRVNRDYRIVLVEDVRTGKTVRVFAKDLQKL